MPIKSILIQSSLSYFVWKGTNSTVTIIFTKCTCSCCCRITIVIYWNPFFCSIEICGLKSRKWRHLLTPEYLYYRSEVWQVTTFKLMFTMFLLEINDISEVFKTLKFRFQDRVLYNIRQNKLLFYLLIEVKKRFHCFFL